MPTSTIDNLPTVHFETTISAPGDRLY